NGASMARDFENFCAIAHLMSALIDWTQANSVFWQSPQLSLENLYVTTMHNICSLWEQHSMWDRLKADGEKLACQLPSLRDNESIQQAGETVSRLGLYHFRKGEYGRAALLFKGVMSRIEALPEDECPALIRIQHRNRLLSALSEAGDLDAADMTAVALENEIETVRKRGWTPLDGRLNITPESLHSTLVNELGICLMNHAIVASRRGESELGLQLLNRTEALVREESESSDTCADILRRVEYFRKNGLPTPQEPSGDEKRYRELQNRLFEILHQPSETDAAAKASADRFEACLVELDAIHQKGLFGNDREFAGFYYHLFMLRHQAGERQAAVKALLRAKKLADGDREPSPLYGRIYSDWTAFCPPDKQLEAAQKAIAVFEALRKRGAQYSNDDLAMALWNRGLIFFNMSRWSEARADVNQAIVLWKKALKTGDSETLRAQLAEAQRLLREVERNDSL
ncbi:MAG: hypothetical protein IKR28_07760, partial [Selenomonadaceae bacterium]|nr:hypothetical protein [Selenomonadaceae bacterium]